MNEVIKHTSNNMNLGAILAAIVIALERRIRAGSKREYAFLGVLFRPPSRDLRFHSIPAEKNLAEMCYRNTDL